MTTAIARGAKALDYFQASPEQADTGGEIKHDDFDKSRTVREGRVLSFRPATVGLVLSESTDLGTG